MQQRDVGWKEVWQEVGLPFLSTCLIIYFLIFVVMEVADLILW